MKLDPYSPRVRELFADAAHAGESALPATASGHAQESATGAAVSLDAVVANGRLTGLKFRVFGCPHLVAAAEWACRRFDAEPAGNLAEFDAATCMRELDIPVEKTGRILLLEDAIKSLLGNLDQAANA